ncbi:site-specific DNA-methyltransferase [Aggregatibacter actinomycetemcomitans]|uniref:site-specific DNA-methyltransferase n=1 Tax=Aggregatibacter actinomycetemcomitans TaxID=714 RepID=UPI001F11C607|nr:site-specific DNA-methyltransferase [Aggregatibacter actinomycetemcomitans]
MLHWANKDQYYTKSGENFSNYTFDLNGKKVHFRLVEADVAKDNRKDNEKDRVFVLAEPTIQRHIDENGEEIETDILPIEEKGDELIIRFEYKAMPKGKKQADYLDQAVEKLKSFAFQNEAYLELFSLMPTEKEKERTLLKKYLQDYTAKNTADYFIHKNLGKFLNQELDFYIKNEVMNLDNIQAETAFSEIEQHLQQIKILKNVAQEIIAFLAQLEDFQKKLWLKKKFVAGTHYLITLDHLSDELIEAVLANAAQLEQWQTLFNVKASGLTAEKLRENYPHLVVDTSLFEPSFQADILKTIENLDEQTNGLLIHSDNFQALNLLQARYKEQVKCIYIDPPYNTEKDRKEGKFIYKDNFPSSSWISLISSRLEVSKYILSDSGVIISSIDDNEHSHLKLAFDEAFGRKNFIGNIPRLTSAQRPSQEKYFSITNDYLLFYAKNKEYDFNNVIERDLSNVLEDENGKYIPGDTSPILASSTQGYSAGGDYDIWLNGKLYSPTDSKGNRRRWLWTKERMDKAIELDIVVETPTTLRVRNYINKEFEVGTNKLIDKDSKLILTSNDLISASYANSQGTDILRKIGLGDIFDFPKPISLLKLLFELSTSNEIVMDYFGGSGTTAHAVIDLNRNNEDSNRKYILVEQGEYFDTVLKPRVQKVIFSEKWKEGKPEAGENGLNGVSQIVKVLKLESYEDTLNNLELRKPTYAFDFDEQVQNDYLLHYMLDVESRGSLLSTEHFAKPFDYELNIATSSAGAYQPQKIDLVETFNYLIGLRVNTVDDRRERGIVTVEGTLASGEKNLIIWRDVERMDYEALNRYLDSRDINPQDSEYDVVYINGDHNIPTVFADSDDVVKTLKVRSIEGEFLERMFS